MIRTKGDIGVAKDYICVALDVDSLDVGLKLLEPIAAHVGCIKVGLELLTAEGAPRVVRAIHDIGGRVFFDGKFNDIPTTVGKASKVVSSLGVYMFNVHASSSAESMKAAVENAGNAIVLAVTVLTSIKPESELFFGVPAERAVLRFAKMASDAGVNGIICSPKELNTLNAQPALSGLMYVTPGIRPKGASTNDQKRPMTPFEAVKAGSDMLVIGRPILQPEIGVPLEAVKRTTDEIEQALEEMRREQRS